MKKNVSLLLSLVMLISVASGLSINAYALTNDFKNASTLAFDRDYTGQLNKTNKSKVYKIGLNKTGRIKITAKRSRYNFNLNIYNEQGDLLTYECVQRDSQEYTYSFIKGTYFLKLVYTNTDEQYLLNVNYMPYTLSFDETQSVTHDAFETANKISVNKEYNGALTVSSYKDYYKISVSEPTKVQVRLGMKNLRSTNVFVYDRLAHSIINRSYTHQGNSGVDDYSFTVTLSEGDNYIVVDSSSLHRTGDYSLKVIATGWMKQNNKWYYYDGAGKALKGWQKINGKQYYFQSNGMMATYTTKIGDKWYYFNGSGIMQTGWIRGKNTFYADKNGVLKTGWQTIDGKRYLFKYANAQMIKGWYKTSNGVYYYFNNTGAMVTGWQKISNKWYYFNSNGTMKTGWLKSGGKWYYLDSSGAMLANTSRKIGGKTYKYDASGACTNP